MDFRESETIELKSVVVYHVKKEIIAFANSNGGTLYIGISDNGEINNESGAEHIKLLRTCICVLGIDGHRKGFLNFTAILGRSCDFHLHFFADLTSVNCNHWAMVPS